MDHLLGRPRIDGQAALQDALLTVSAWLPVALSEGTAARFGMSVCVTIVLYLDLMTLGLAAADDVLLASQRTGCGPELSTLSEADRAQLQVALGHSDPFRELGTDARGSRPVDRSGARSMDQCHRAQAPSSESKLKALEVRVTDIAIRKPSSFEEYRLASKAWEHKDLPLAPPELWQRRLPQRGSPPLSLRFGSGDHLQGPGGFSFARPQRHIPIRAVAVRAGPPLLEPKSVPVLLIGPEIADTKSQADHAQSRFVARHPLRMKVFDPLVSLESAARADLRGWAVAAAIIARLQEVGLSGGIDMRAILGPAISDLSESELEELAGQMFGPLMDIPRCFLGQHVREWQTARQVRPEQTANGRPRDQD